MFPCVEHTQVQLNPGNSNCQRNLKLLRVIGVSSYRGFEQKDYEHLIKVVLRLYIYLFIYFIYLFSNTATPPGEDFQLDGDQQNNA